MTDPAGVPDKHPRPLPGLSDEHLTYLTNAAITPDIAAAAGVYTATEIADLPRELHRWERGLPGIVFPWWRAAMGPSGEPGAEDILWQLRPDHPLTWTDEHDRPQTAKYLFPPGCDGALNVHPLMRQGAHNPTAPVLLVEGTKQTLAAVSALAGSEFAVVGMAGCYGWSQRKLLIEDLKAVPWRGREVLLCLDADVTTNRDVWESATKLRDWLTLAMSAEVVRLIRIPGSGSQGLDDILAQTIDPREAVTNMIESARAAKTKTEKWPTRPPRKRSSEYFDEDGGLLAEDMAIALLAEHPCALAIDETIAVYDEGRYRIRRRGILPYVTEMLANKHRPIHLATAEQSVTGRLMGDGRVLGERPPTALLNVRNGMLDLESPKLELHPHDPDHMSTVQLAVEWDPDAVCPVYDAWLPTVIKASAIPLIEETAAQMFDMLRTPNRSMFLFGPARSGKSTFLRLMEAIMGKDNTSGVTLHELADNDFSRAELYGKKLNIAADISAKHIDDLSVWKRLTGDDLVSANRKHGAMFAFRNQALFAFAANEPPSVGESSRAYFSRIRAFEFPTSFEGHIDSSMEENMLANELPGILRRWVGAYRRGHKRGSELPSDPETTAKFETQSDRVRLWMSEELTVVTVVPGADKATAGGRAVVEGTKVPPGFGTAPKVLFEEFRSWALDNGYSVLGFRKFVERVTSVDSVVNVRINPTSIRGYNLIKRKDDHESGSSWGMGGSSKEKATYAEDTHDNEDPQSVSQSCIGDLDPETALTAPADDSPLEPLPSDGPSPVEIDFSVVTVVVYAAIAAEPMITLKALEANLGLSKNDLASEIEHLERGAAIMRRRPKRGFDVLAPIVEAVRDYEPCADPEWVNTTGERRGEPSDRQLLRFEYRCVMCDEPDDELSEYFPVCKECRLKAGE